MQPLVIVRCDDLWSVDLLQLLGQQVQRLVHVIASLLAEASWIAAAGILSAKWATISLLDSKIMKAHESDRHATILQVYQTTVQLLPKVES